ncbi:multiple sugar transport system substrate-binding protein [Paenibacillus endophyticus]|uniref:Multiple sugar transport system substrate-binding protein n=1 Tax=Paenibacillus endophyticus TaxID=1294268 RepID=A0A7W5C308_9BACL|nr:extracellular solute-binding protein [Paenibacillus endophyticus]MBB3150273.1 multiple sugar transport system substrate-binding protein [Paenibacillus endophyticus]
MKNKHSRKTFRLRQDEMLQQLRNEIITGKRAEGQYLPSEKSLSDQFGLSNKTVRTVLDALVDEQLIEKLPRVGNRVVNLGERQKMTIKLGHHGTTLLEAGLSDLLAAFHNEYPHIQVQDVTLPAHSPDVMKPYMDYGMIDVMTLNDSEFQDFVETNSGSYLAPLEEMPDMYPFLTDVFRVNGELLSQPFMFSPAILCYNRNHFELEGLLEPDGSWDWDELFDAANQLNIDNERIGFHFSVSQRNRCAVFLLQSGAIFEKRSDGCVKLCGTAMMEGIRYYKDMIANRMTSLLPKQDTNFHAEELFAQGKISMMITTYLSLNRIRESGIDYDVAQLPHLKVPATHLISIGLSVNKQSPHVEAARVLVDFLTSHKAQLLIRQKTLSLPSLKTAAEWAGHEDGYRPARFNMYREIIPTFRYNSELGLTESEWNLFFNEALTYWSGLETEASFCSRVEALL